MVEILRPRSTDDYHITGSFTRQFHPEKRLRGRAAGAVRRLSVWVGQEAAGREQGKNGATGTVTVEDVRAQIPGLKNAVDKGFKAIGLTMDSAEYSDPADSTLAGETCVTLDSTTTVSADGNSAEIIQRWFYVGGKGFIITASAADKASLDDLVALIDSMIVWD